MARAMRPEKFALGRHFAIRLLGCCGDVLRTLHTESYPRARNPNTVVVVSGTVDWVREDTNTVIMTLKDGDTGDKLPDPQQGNYRFVATTPVMYYCVSRADGQPPLHRRLELSTGQIADLPPGSMAILLTGAVTANGYPTSELGALLSAEHGIVTLTAASDATLEVFE